MVVGGRGTRGGEEKRKVSLDDGAHSKGDGEKKEKVLPTRKQKEIWRVTCLRLGFSSAEERRLLTSCSTMMGRSAGSDRRSSKEISTCVEARITR